MPNLAYVHDQAVAGRTTKACQRGLMNYFTGTWGGTPEIQGWGGHSFLTMGEYRSKALSAVKPHEELEPLELNHELRRLIEQPNPVDTAFDLFYEKKMFDLLCGVSYVWAVPNRWGKPCELWVLPSHWVWPRTGGGRLMDREYFPGGSTHAPRGRYVPPDDPYADRLIHYYEIRPWGGMGSSGVLWLPPDEVIMFRRKSPLNKIDGYSPLEAVAQWIDSEESISASRWAQFQNQARPEFWIELGPGYEDPDDERIKRLESKLAYKIQGEYNYGKPFITPPGAKVTPLSFNPTEMAYYQSEEQIRDMLGSAFMVPKTAVGISSDMTYGSVLATLAQLCSNCLNPHLTADGQTFTKSLASRWDEPAGPTWGNGVTLPLEEMGQEAPAEQAHDVPGTDYDGPERPSPQAADNALVPPEEEATGWPPRRFANKSWKLRSDVYEEGLARWDNWFGALGGKWQHAWQEAKALSTDEWELETFAGNAEALRLASDPATPGTAAWAASKALTAGFGGHGNPRRVKLWWDDCVPADPDQVNSDLAEDRANFAVTPNEVRALRGRRAYAYGGDDPIFQGGPAGVLVLPFNTGQKQDKLAKLLEPLLSAGQQGGGGAPGGEAGPGGPVPPNALPDVTGREGPPERLGDGTTPPPPSRGAPNIAVPSENDDSGVAEPNGEPSKALGKGWRPGDALAEAASQEGLPPDMVRGLAARPPSDENTLRAFLSRQGGLEPRAVDRVVSSWRGLVSKGPKSRGGFFA